MRSWIKAFGIGVCLLAWALPAVAQPGEGDGSAESEGSGVLWLAAMLKVGGGGNLLPAPDNAPAFAQPFDDGVGGYAFTIGPVVELRMLRGLLGFQTGLIFDFVTNLSQLDINSVEYTIGWSGTDLRVPFLFQVGTPGEGTRLYFTTGPELVAGLSASPTVEVDPPVPLGGVVSVNTATRANWVVGLGLATPISVLRLGFDIQFAYTLGVPSTYVERVSVGIPGGWTTDAQTAMDLRLLFNIGYDFGAIVK